MIPYLRRCRMFRNRKTCVWPFVRTGQYLVQRKRHRKRQYLVHLVRRKRHRKRQYLAQRNGCLVMCHVPHAVSWCVTYFVSSLVRGLPSVTGLVSSTWNRWPVDPQQQPWSNMLKNTQRKEGDEAGQDEDHIWIGCESQGRRDGWEDKGGWKHKDDVGGGGMWPECGG